MYKGFGWLYLLSVLLIPVENIQEYNRLGNLEQQSGEDCQACIHEIEEKIK